MNTYLFRSRDDTQQSLNEVMGSPVLAFDVESTGLNAGRAVPLGVSVASLPGAAFYVSKDYMPGLVFLEDPSKVLIAHNGKFDRSMLKKAGYTVDSIIDTMIAAHLIGTYPLKLKSLTNVVLGYDITEYDELHRPVQQLSFQEAAEYSCPHAYSTMSIWNKLYGELKRLGFVKVFMNIEMPLIPVLSDMELNGVCINKDKLIELGKEFDGNIEILEDAMNSCSGTVGINWNSPDQVADMFFNKLKFPAPHVHTTKGRPSVDERYLEPLVDKYPLVNLYFRYKGYQKLKGTYVDGIVRLLVGDRVYGNFNQTGTGTSRLSSSNPNLQNIPVRDEDGRKIRTAFVAPPGKKLVKADDSQLELRMMAHRSQDPAMLGAFRARRDIHLETAMRVYHDLNRRYDAKTLNYTVQYGGGDKRSQDAFFGAYPGVKLWIDMTTAECEESGCARTLFGRVRRIYDLDSSIPRIRAHGDREAISTCIQGSSAEVVKIQMRRVWEYIRNSSIRMVLQVHDELVFEVPEREVADFAQFLYKNMRYDELSLPFTVDVSVGDNWGEMEKVDEL